MLFTDRIDAGRQLGAALRYLAGPDVVVLGLPRGGVVVAYEVAQALAAPLDVIVVRKLGAPFQPELAMGAIGEDGVQVMDDDVLRACRVEPGDVARVERRERTELARRLERLRGARRPVSLAGRTVIIVDDGVATGSTARAACQVARARGAGRVVLAVPVAPAATTARLHADADDVRTLYEPEPFFAIGEFYGHFGQVSDDEVVALLRRAGPLPQAGGGDWEVEFDVDGARIGGRLTVPDGAPGIVVFAHGSGSSRHSPRNRYVAGELQGAGIGTLLIDLLTEREEGDRANVFDVDLLGSRLLGATAWLREQPEAAGRAIGYFGASTGAAAAIRAAAAPEADVGAIVSRGGRPDLAAPWLAAVCAPTLLIVGGRDDVVLELNQRARERLRCASRLAVVPGATHLFEEPGALEEVAALAADWFTRHLALAKPSPIGT